MLGGGFNVISGKFLGSKGVRLRAQAVEFLIDLPGLGPMLRALEKKMLQEMRNSVEFFYLIFRARSEQNPKRNRLGILHLSDDGPESVFKSFFLEFHRLSIIYD